VRPGEAIKARRIPEPLDVPLAQPRQDWFPGTGLSNLAS